MHKFIPKPLSVKQQSPLYIVHCPCRQHHSISPCSLMSFCSWSCLSLYFGIKTVIFCYGTSIKFELCKYLISNRISYEKNENQDLQVVSYYVALLLAYTSWILFIFILSVFEAFLLSLLHCCWMDDDLEFCLVMELIIFLPLRKNGFSEKFWIKFNFLH